MKKLFPIIIFSLLLVACQPPIAPAEDLPTETPVPVESTLSPADVFATAIAAGEATKVAGPTSEPTSTPKPAPTICTKVDRELPSKSSRGCTEGMLQNDRA